MNRNTALGALVLVTILGGIIAYAVTRPATPQDFSGVPMESPYVEHADYYDIAANYPTTTPLTGAKSSEALNAMHAYVATEVALFKTQGHFDSLSAEDLSMLGYDQGRKETLQIAYLFSTHPANTPRTASYIFTEYLDTLGAHGNTFFRTFTFDLDTGQQLTIGDLFQPGSGYLGRLSSLTRTYLAKSLAPYADEQMINDGTRPAAQSFQNFFLDNGTLAILYAPYEVAAYAAGPQTVRIPLSDLSDILKPEYR